MRVAIVGTGAMGGLFASHLAATDVDLWCLDIRQDHVEAITRRGLTVDQAGVVRQVPLQITSDLARPGPCDVVIIFTKYRQTQAALDAMAPLLHATTLLVTLQNGIGNVEMIQAAFPRHRILFGLTTGACTLVGPGHIRTSGLARTQTHAWLRGGEPDAPIRQFAALMQESGIPFHLSRDIEVQIWKKLAVNCALSTACAVSGVTVGEVAALPHSWPMLMTVADEIAAVGKANGVPLTQDGTRRYLREVADASASHIPSMAADISAGRPTEIDCLTGAVLREAARHSIPTPVIQTLDTLVRLIERRQSRVTDDGA